MSKVSFPALTLDGREVAETTVVILEFGPAVDYDTGAQQIDDRTNLPKWRMEIVRKPHRGRKVMEEIGFAAAATDVPPRDTWDELDPEGLVLVGLTARPWANDNRNNTLRGGVIQEAAVVRFDGNWEAARDTFEAEQIGAARSGSVVAPAPKVPAGSAA